MCTDQPWWAVSANWVRAQQHVLFLGAKATIHKDKQTNVLLNMVQHSLLHCSHSHKEQVLLVSLLPLLYQVLILLPFCSFFHSRETHSPTGAGHRCSCSFTLNHHLCVCSRCLNHRETWSALTSRPFFPPSVPLYRHLSEEVCPPLLLLTAPNRLTVEVRRGCLTPVTPTSHREDFLCVLSSRTVGMCVLEEAGGVGLHLEWNRV